MAANKKPKIHNKRLHISLPSRQYRAVRIYAAQEEISLAEASRRILTQFLDEFERKQKEGVTP